MSLSPGVWASFFPVLAHRGRPTGDLWVQLLHTTPRILGFVSVTDLLSVGGQKSELT